MKRNQQELILRLQNWYYQYCNGDWEHNENINIHTIDNPGWRVTVDLDRTGCESKPFTNVEKETSKDDWYHCFLRDGKFEGAGGPNNLTDIIETFLTWVESVK
ncbi:MAG: immunity 53 family protein [Anaerolineae bacterium]